MAFVADCLGDLKVESQRPASSTLHVELRLEICVSTHIRRINLCCVLHSKWLTV